MNFFMVLAATLLGLIGLTIAQVPVDIPVLRPAYRLVFTPGAISPVNTLPGPEGSIWVPYQGGGKLSTLTGTRYTGPSLSGTILAGGGWVRGNANSTSWYLDFKVVTQLNGQPAGNFLNIEWECFAGREATAFLVGTAPGATQWRTLMASPKFTPGKGMTGALGVLAEDQWVASGRVIRSEAGVVQVEHIFFQVERRKD